jgi:hypothetical protein
MKQRIFALVTLLSICGRGMSTVSAQSVPSAPSYQANFVEKMTDAGNEGVAARNPDN